MIVGVFVTTAEAVENLPRAVICVYLVENTGK